MCVSVRLEVPYVYTRTMRNFRNLRKINDNHILRIVPDRGQIKSKRITGQEEEKCHEIWETRGKLIKITGFDRG